MCVDVVIGTGSMVKRMRMSVQIHVAEIYPRYVVDIRGNTCSNLFNNWLYCHHSPMTDDQGEYDYHSVAWNNTL